MTGGARSVPGAGGWRLQAHEGQAPLTPDWHDELARRLGHRPRRLGEWTEVALYGALRCLHAAGEAALPPTARLRLLSRGGPAQAQRAALAQSREGLPMPFTFMQSQPAITLAALAQALHWQGDAAFVAARDVDAAIWMGLHGAGAAGALVGVVEAGGPGGLRSEWWRWTRA
ncbi:hypothetical protein [Xenophilus sp. Marseille-Q4582]|uniref:hypothetical protein n=1 Tax=Xenophilus sp. Marseille-Q4582 TaxID=2866600 RepID=UPI001CE41366|nr:hypothetical protein [Xenophilus sp. Marseille-Q4582]